MSDIQHAHLYGMREAKYDWLSTHNVLSTEWKEVSLQKPFHLFISQNNNLLAEFQAYWKIIEAMPINVLGFQTHRDNFAIDLDFDAIKQRLDDLRNLDISDQEIQEKYDLNESQGWKIKDERKQIQQNKDWALVPLHGKAPNNNPRLSVNHALSSYIWYGNAIHSDCRMDKNEKIDPFSNFFRRQFVLALI